MKAKAWTLEYFEQAVKEAEQAIQQHTNAPRACACSGLYSCSERRKLYRHLDLMRYRRDWIRKHGNTRGMPATSL